MTAAVDYRLTIDADQLRHTSIHADRTAAVEALGAYADASGSQPSATQITDIYASYELAADDTGRVTATATVERTLPW